MSSLTLGNSHPRGHISKRFSAPEVGEILKPFFMAVLNWMSDLRTEEQSGRKVL